MRRAACHGAKLEGQPDWQKRLPNGRFRAPPHDAEIRAVLAYIRSRRPAEVLERRAEMLRNRR